MINRALVLSMTLVLAGCQTIVPVKQKFPEAPAQLMEPPQPLQPLPTGRKVQLSDIIGNASKNYGQYYELEEKYNAWQQWYIDQKKNADDVEQ